MKVLALIVIKFFLISALFVISNGNLHMADPIEREVFFNIYSDWLGTVFNQGIELAGNIIDSQWLPQNNFTEVG